LTQYKLKQSIVDNLPLVKQAYNLVGGLGDCTCNDVTGAVSPAERERLYAEQCTVAWQSILEARDAHEVNQPDFVNAALTVTDEVVHFRAFEQAYRSGRGL
jgi:Tfp pilus assembly ATPase PilU